MVEEKSNININLDGLNNIIKDLTIEKWLLFFGGLGILVSIYSKYELGLEISLNTLIFGIVFRCYNLFRRAYFSKGLPKNKVNYRLTALFVFIFELLLLLIFFLVVELPKS